ncbi:MAG: caspase family protein [Gemmataceae bacterium]
MRTAAFALVVAAAALPAADPPAGARHALLIGVNRYDSDDLKPLAYAEADVTDLASLLKEKGFTAGTVTLMTTAGGKADAKLAPTRANVQAAFQALLGRLKAADVALVAFAGRGMQKAGGPHYAVPADGKLDDPATLFNVSEAYRQLQAGPAGWNLLLVDTSRDDPAAGGVRPPAAKLNSVTRPVTAAPANSTAALFSCSVGQRSFESPDLKHGVFFHSVLEGWRGKAGDPAARLSWLELAVYVSRDVPRYVQETWQAEQRPEMVGSMRGHLDLSPPKPAG